MKLARLARTIAPLKPIQIYGRLLFLVRRPKPDRSSEPPRRHLIAGWTQPIARPECMTGACSVVFLNRAGDIAQRDQWNDPASDKLWLYNLHYFDALGAQVEGEAAAWREDLVRRWIEENPPGLGNGWEPYPTSLRVVNWIKWVLAGWQTTPTFLQSLAMQVRWLEKRLEWHLLGNHLFANAKALVFAGLFFQGPEAERWLTKGIEILEKEIEEQVLADGGHFELSPMYHAIIYEDVLDLLNLAAAVGRRDIPPFAEWREVAARMGRWLGAMTHPDGGIAFFNDAAFGIAAEPAALESYARRLGLPPIPPPPAGLTHLDVSGYVRMQNDRVVALLDVAAVGPDYLPGHAHADSLSFELSIDGRRVIVNGGTSTYAGAERGRERGTAAHSTVEVAGLDSSETWGSFRVGRRARTTTHEVGSDGKDLFVSASHDGYRFLPDRPLHQRTWRLRPRGLEIRDELSGGTSLAVARFHLAAGIAARLDGDSHVAALDGGIRVEANVPLTLEPSSHAVEFGRVESSLALRADVPPGGLVTRIEW
jgi:uncharacterized heparinase superfamily protein